MSLGRLPQAVLLSLGLSTAVVPAAQPPVSDDARALTDRGRSELDAGRFGEAAATLTAARERHHANGDLVGEAAALLKLGNAYYGLGRRADGLTASQQAVALCKQAGDSRCEAEALYVVGTFHFWLAEYPAALDQYEASLTRWRTLGDLEQQGLLLTEMGWLFWMSGDSSKAIAHYNEALPLSAVAGDKRNEGYARNNLGLAYSFMGDTDAALDYFRRALDLRREAADVNGEAQTLGNMCGVSWRIGEYQNALDVCARAWQLARTVNDRATQAWSLDMMGLAYWSVGDSARALAQHQEALTQRRALDDRQGLPHTLNNLGWVHLTLGERSQARRYFDEALNASRSVKDVRNEALALNNLGVHAYHEGAYARALEHLEAALRLRRAAADRRGEGQTLHNLARTQAARGQHALADEQYRAAGELFRSIGDRSSEANTLLALAAHAAERDELPAARTRAEEALSVAESLRTNIAGRDLRMSYLAARQNYYELYIDVLMRLHRQDPAGGHVAAALQISERARARGLLEALAESRSNIREGVDPALLDRERVSRRRLDTRERARMELLNRRHTPEQATASERELEVALQEYRDVQTDIRLRSPRYAELTQPQPLALNDIQSRVLDEQTVLLEYRLGEERSYVWAVTPTSIRGFTLPPRSRIETVARRFYDLVVESHLRTARVPTEQAGRELGAMLLGPVVKELGRKRLVIVPDGILDYVPFTALSHPGDVGSACPPNTRYCPLIVDHEIATLPSISVVDVIRRETANRPRSSKALAVFSDPVFDASDARISVRRPATEPAAFERLPFSRREADAIAALAPAGRTLKAVDFEANRQTTTHADLADYRFVHFATHGIVDSARPELSGLVLSLVDREGRPQDGFLRVHDLYNLQLGADVVVLSACRTALGKEIKGEGIVGLTRGFMYAGSPRVVASLWDVRDAATAELMTRFYREMLTNERSPAAALRAAQTAMWRGGTYEAPFYWAGFVLQGEWR